jgi:hypothetical protein
LIWWFIVWVVDFDGFFIFFSLLLSWLFAYSFINREKFSKVDDQEILDIPKVDEDFD